MGWEASASESVNLLSPNLMRFAFWALQPQLSKEAPALPTQGARSGCLDVSAGMACSRDVSYPQFSLNGEPQQLYGTLDQKVLLPSKRSFLQMAMEAAAKGPCPSKRHERVIQHRDRSTSYSLGGVRCLRTDGKHWRCKREALAEQKYCEKHQHRGHHYGRKRRRKGEDDQQLGAEKIFQGWTKHQALWQGFSQPPESQVAPALLSGSAPWMSSPVLKLDEASQAQWTPMQQQILQATLSDFGSGSGPSSRADADAHGYLRETFPQALAGDFHGPKLQEEGRLPDILRVGPDQLILSPSVKLAPDGSGRFTLRVLINHVASLGISVTGDKLVSTWDSSGSRAPIYIVPGGRSKLVKLEFLRHEGDCVVFKGNSQQTDSEDNACLSLTGNSEGPVGSLDLAPKAAPRELSGRRRLDLDLNLDPPAGDLEALTESSVPFSVPDEAAAVQSVCTHQSSGKPPKSPHSRTDALSVMHASCPLESRASQGSAMQTSSVPLLEDSHTQGLQRIPHHLERQKGGARQACTGSPPGSDLQRSASLSFESCTGGAPLPRASSLPMHCVRQSGLLETRFKKLGGSGVASLILQTPKGVFLESGKPLDVETDRGDSSGKESGRKREVSSASEGEGSDAETPTNVTDSATSELDSVKRSRGGEGDVTGRLLSKKARFLTEYKASMPVSDRQSQAHVGWPIQFAGMGSELHKQGCQQLAHPPWFNTPASIAKAPGLQQASECHYQNLRGTLDGKQGMEGQCDSSLVLKGGVAKTEPSESPLLELRIATPLLCIPRTSGSERSMIGPESARASGIPSLEEAWLHSNERRSPIGRRESKTGQEC